MNVSALRLAKRATIVIALTISLTALAEEAPKRAEHIVVVVFDGLRPDSVTAADMPTLHDFAQRGTTFSKHHSVFPSSTEVNGSALATGGYPRRDGVVANVEYRPDIDLSHPIAIEEEPVIRKGDQSSGGHYLLMPTVAEILKRDGRATAIAGTKPVALLFDRAERTDAESKRAPVLYQGNTLPADLLAGMAQLPEKAEAKKKANSAQDEWTAKVVTGKFWAAEVPAFTVVWFSEPDYAQHGSGPGSSVSKEALKSDDDNFKALLAKLDQSGVRDKTDVLVVSDHGFSTISRTIELVALLKGAGIDAAETFDGGPKKGQVLVVGLGGSATFYAGEHDAATIHKVVEFLQKSDFAGVILAREPMDGTFTLEQAGVDSANAPDVMVSFRWTEEKNANGVPGQVVSQGSKRGPGQGIHASLSPFDMHNTLIAGGPDFRAGFVDDSPSGNADLAPTVLWLLGYPDAAASMDGRVLAEAINHGPAAPDKIETRTLRATATAGGVAWQQYLEVAELGRYRYLNRGNAGDTGRP